MRLLIDQFTGGFIEAHLGKIQSIKCYDYTNKHLSTMIASPGQKTWSDIGQILNGIAGVQAEFTPHCNDYHLQITMKEIKEKTHNLVKILPNLSEIHSNLSNSIERIRDEIRTIKTAVSKLQLDPSFDLNKLLLRDDILLALNRRETFEKDPENEITLSNLPQDIVVTIIRMEKPEALDNLRPVRKIIVFFLKFI